MKFVGVGHLLQFRPGEKRCRAAPVVPSIPVFDTRALGPRTGRLVDASAHAESWYNDETSAQDVGQVPWFITDVREQERERVCVCV